MLVCDLYLLHSVLVKGIAQMDTLLVLLFSFLPDCRCIYQEYIFCFCQGRSICLKRNKRRQHKVKDFTKERNCS